MANIRDADGWIDDATEQRLNQKPEPKPTTIHDVLVEPLLELQHLAQRQLNLDAEAMVAQEHHDAVMAAALYHNRQRNRSRWEEDQP